MCPINRLLSIFLAFDTRYFYTRIEMGLIRAWKQIVPITISIFSKNQSPAMYKQST